MYHVIILSHKCNSRKVRAIFSYFNFNVKFLKFILFISFYSCYFSFVFFSFLIFFFFLSPRCGFKTDGPSGRNARSAREVATPLYSTARRRRTPPPLYPSAPLRPPPRAMGRRAPPPPRPSAPPPTTGISWNLRTTLTMPHRTGVRCTTTAASAALRDNSRSSTGSHREIL